MSRPLRIEYDGAWYHVINRGQCKRNIYLTDIDYTVYFELLNAITEIYSVEIHAFSLMPNNYHLLVHTPKKGLSRAMKYLNGTYTQKFNKIHELNRNDELGYLFNEYKKMIRENEKHQVRIKKETCLQVLFDTASQVSHDIRSPLSALGVATSDLKELPEEKRVLIRSAVQRIEDIANDLASKKDHRPKTTDNRPKEEKKQIQDKLKVRLLSSIINSLISEKRMEYRSCSGINIESNLGQSAYGLFAKIQTKEFKRLLSNLINNSIEAIGGDGDVDISMGTDGPKGLPPTHNASARQGGAYGPTEERQTTSVIILDDDDSIHHIWQNRFNELGIPKEVVKHFKDPYKLIFCYKANEPKRQGAVVPMLFLCDYELLGSDKTGLQVIEELGIQGNAVLVTSHFEEEDVRAQCARLGVKLLPKNLAGYVPVIVDSGPQIVDRGEKGDLDCHVANAPRNDRTLDPSIRQTRSGRAQDAILIDDDPLIRKAWQIMAKRCGTRLHCFTKPDEFFDDIDAFDKEVPLYIDSNLADGLKGENVAKNISDKGFTNIYLATGSSPDEFPSMPWIKEIIGKAPPFRIQ